MAPPTVRTDATGRAGTVPDVSGTVDPFEAERLPKRGIASASTKTDAVAPGGAVTIPGYKLTPEDVRTALTSVHEKFGDLNYERFKERFPAGKDYKEGHAATEQRDNQFKTVQADAVKGDKNSQLFLMVALTEGGAGMAGEPITVGNKELGSGFSIWHEDGNEGRYYADRKGIGLRAAEALSAAAANPSASAESRRQLATLIPYSLMAGTIDSAQRAALLPGLSALSKPGPDGTVPMPPIKESQYLMSAIACDVRTGNGEDGFQRQAMARLLELQPLALHDQIQDCLNFVISKGQPGAQQAARESLAALRSPAVNANEMLASLLEEKLPVIPGYKLPEEGVPIRSAQAPGGATDFTPGPPGQPEGGRTVAVPPELDDAPAPVLNPTQPVTTGEPPRQTTEVAPANPVRFTPPPPQPGLGFGPVDPPQAPLPADLAPPPDQVLAVTAVDATQLTSAKAADAAKGAESIKLPDNVKVDEKGGIKQILYPDGSSADFGKDASGALNAVTIRDKSGEHKFVREGDDWFSLTNGKTPFNGKMELRANGDLVGPLGDGSRRLVWQPDGQTHTEKSLATGALVTYNSEGYAQSLVRKDGSTVADISQGTTAAYVETANGKAVKWSLMKGQPGNGDDIWVSDSNPADQRRAMQLEKNGNLTYFGAGGEKHIIRSNGAEVIEGPGRSSYTFDDLGRIKSVAYPDGNNVFSFNYKANSEQIDTVATHYNRSGIDKVNKPDRTWGEPMLSPDGVYSQMSYQVIGGQVFKGLQTFNTNGEFVYNTVHTDGTVHITDAYNKKQYALRNAVVNDFVQPNGSDAPADPAQQQQLREQLLKQQQADKNDRANQLAAEQMQQQQQQQQRQLELQRQQVRQVAYDQPTQPYRPYQQLQQPSTCQQRPQQSYYADNQSVQRCRQACNVNGSCGTGGCGADGGGCGGSCGGSCGGGGGGGCGGGGGGRFGGGGYGGGGLRNLRMIPGMGGRFGGYNGFGGGGIISRFLR